MDWHVVYVQKMTAVQVVIPDSVRIKIGVRTEKCSMSKGIKHCYECSSHVKKKGFV